MKKMLIAIYIFLMGFGVFAEGFDFYSFGFFAYDIRNSEPSTPDNELLFETDICVGIKYEFLYFEAEQNVRMTKWEDITFSPYEESYFIRIGVTFSYFKLEYEHLCVHAVSKPGGFGEYDRIMIKFDSRGMR